MNCMFIYVYIFLVYFDIIITYLGGCAGRACFPTKWELNVCEWINEACGALSAQL